jgi:hypothetical protein
MIRRAALIMAFILAYSPFATAEDDFTVSKGELSNRDFYRAIACGAEVGGWCRTPIVKWPSDKRHPLRIYVEDPQSGFPAEKVKAIVASVRLAITEINVSGADIRLEYSEDRSAPIHVYMVGARVGETMQDTGSERLDGSVIQAGIGSMRWNGVTHEIVEASVGIASDIPKQIIRSVVLEEIIQVLGLPWDIRNPAYTGKSIFSEDSNNIFKIRRQDTFALRLHYPTGCEKASDCLQ